MTTLAALPLMASGIGLGGGIRKSGIFSGQPDYTGTPNEYPNESNYNVYGGNRLPVHNKPAQWNIPKQSAAMPEPFPSMHPDDMKRMIDYTRGKDQSAPLPQAPQYDPRYENASRENYAAQMGNIRGALAPIKEHHNSLINQLNAYGAQGGYKGSGGGIAAATALGLMQNDYDTQAGLAKEEARLAGGLAPINIQAMHYGMEPRQQAQKSIFEEKLPSKIASTESARATAEQAREHAKLYGQQSALGQIPVDAIMRLPKEKQLEALQKFQGHGGKEDGMQARLMEHRMKAIMDNPAMADPKDPMVAFLKLQGLIPAEAKK